MSDPPTRQRYSTPPSKPTRILHTQLIIAITLLGLCVLPFFAGAFAKPAAGNKFSSVSQREQPARLSQSIRVHAAGRGNPTINLSDGHEVVSSYSGPAALRAALEDNQAQPLSLASADFDEDGVPDLVSGYAYNGQGIVTLLRGNVDAIYPNTPEAKQRRASGATTESPFLSPAHIFTVPVAPDFVGAGDFDGDGHSDVVVASRSGSSLYLLSGEGHGSFAQAKEIALPGLVTAMVTGDLNRPDGLADVIVGVNGAGGSNVMVFEGPEGALRSSPEIFVTRSPVVSLVVGQLDEDPQGDLAIAAGQELLVVSGRDRKLSLNDQSRAQVKAATIARRTFSSGIRSIVGGNFTGTGHSDIAILSDDGVVRLLSREVAADETARSARPVERWSDQVVSNAQWPAASQLVTARISGLPIDELIAVDSQSLQLHLLTRVPGSTGALLPSGEFDFSGSRPNVTSLDSDGEPLAVLPMKLNGDALSDLVLFRKGQTAPTVINSSPSAIITVNSNLDNNERDNKLTLREAILISNGELLVAALTAAERFQVVGTPGLLDRIEFNITGTASSFEEGPDETPAAGRTAGNPEGMIFDPSTYLSGQPAATLDPFQIPGAPSAYAEFAPDGLSQAGGLDPTFGIGGKVTTSFSSFYGQVYAIAIQSDAKIVAAGVSGNYNDNISGDFAVARYNTDGTLDSSFGTGGTVTTSFFASGTDIAYAVAIQTDGKIVVAGYARNSTSVDQIAVARYDTNGTLDTTFDGDGKVTTNRSPGGVARAVAIQTDGRIVVAGHEDTIFSDNDFILARFNSNGSVDNTFGSGGIVNTPFISDDLAQALVLLPDGRLVAAGYTGSFLTYLFALARYNSDGSLDSTFGNGGKVVTDFPGFGVDQANALVRQPDGKLIAAGFTSSNFGTNSPGQFALARYNLDGSLDVSFNGSGRGTTDLTSGQDVAYALAFQSDGRLVAAGQANNSGTGLDFSLVRYNCDGSLDTTFDGDGKVTTDFNSSTDIAYDIALQADGRSVIGGYTSTNTSLADFALARYDGTTGAPCNGGCIYAISPSSQIFTQSGGSGSVIVTAGVGCNWTAVNNAAWITVTSGSSGTGDGTVNYSVPVNNGATRTGTITIAGFTFVISQAGVGSPPGSLDSAFGTGGKQTTTSPNFYGQVYATVIQPDGKIVIAGVSGNYNDNLSGDFALARYNTDGSLDSSFGTGGRVTTPFFASGTDIAYAVAIQTDGKIVAAGYARNSTSVDQIAVARYNADGTLDTTFDGDGKVTTNRSPGGVARAVAIQTDGRIVVAGHEDTIFSDNDFILARFNSNGSLDNTFGSGGIVNTPFISNDLAQALVLLSDGRIVAAGYTGSFLTYLFALARYNSDGSLDSTFGNGGKVLTDFPGLSVDQANALVRQPDGKLIAAGFTSSNFGTTSPGQFALARYNLDGSLDVSFNGSGRVMTDLTSGQDVVYGLALQSDGRVVAAGQANNSDTGLDFALARYNCDGSLDVSFDGDGKITNDFNISTDIAHDIALQPDGRIIAAGYTSTNPILSDFALARYEGGGSAFVLSPTNQSFTAGGGNGTVTVTSAGCGWTATSNVPWINISSAGNGTGNGTVNYSVAANSSSLARTGTMNIAGQTFSVLQFGDASSCSVSPIALGQTVNGALEGADCFSPIRSTQTSGNYRADRYSFTGTLGQQVFLSLGSAQFDTYLYLLGTDGNLVAQDEDGGSGTNSRIPAFSGNLTLPTSGTYTIEVTSSQPNITGNYTLDLSVGAATCSYSISPNSQSFASAGGGGSVTVTTGVSCSWTAVSNNGFIMTTSGGSGSGVGTVTYTVAANPNAARTGTITIAGQTFTVFQAAGPGCTYSINPTNQTFTSSGGSNTVSVAAAAGCTWTATSNSAFLQISSGGSGNGNGNVNYTVAANFSGASRAGTLTVAGRTFTVVQSTTGSGISILLLSPLPKVKEPVEIDGTTQPGYAGAPIVEINGAAVGGGNGIEITAGSSLVRGLTLNRFASNNRVSAIVLITNGNNIIENCYIGSNSVGTGSFAAFGAGPIAAGITVRSSSNNRIGGTIPSARNVISGVDGSGIIISGGATANLVQGNYIGTDATGSISLGNQKVGVYIQGASGNTIGGTASGSGNLISGNLDYGVFLQDDAHNNLVVGNIIGANGGGTNAVPNGNAGVFIYNPTGPATPTLDNTIGGTTPTARNIISGNDPYGIVLGQGATGTLVQGNYIGSRADGATALPNTYGITATQATGSTIGGAVDAARNVISGNTLTGVSIGFLNNGQVGGTGTTIQRNYIGTSASGTGPLGNLADGVFVEVQSITHTIQENVIAFNGSSGVRIPDVTTNPGTPGVRIQVVDNSIYSNLGLGIDLGPAGITANDPGDADAGANLLQNFPVLTSFVPVAAQQSDTSASELVTGGVSATEKPNAPEANAVTVSGTLNSTPNSNFTVHWYLSAGSQCVTNQASSQILDKGKIPGINTDGNGNALFTIPLEFPVGINNGIVNCTATETQGNTSEFSACLVVNAANPTPTPTPTPSPTPQWQAVVLTAQQIAQVKAWTVGGRTYVYVKPQFPDAGYRVVNWGQVVRSGNEFTVDASVEKFTGASIQSIVTTAQIYDLGPLADGTYNFDFKTSGTVAKTLQFTVSSVTPLPNPIDNAREFVKQQYRDFLNREADQAGEDFWTDNITKCSDPARRPAGQTEEQCTVRQRETTSGAFFLSPEFQYTGYYVYRMYQGGLGRQPKLSEFTADAQFVGAGILVNGQLSGAKINQNKADFAQQFVNCTDAAKYRCAEFKAIYDSLNNQMYVDKLFQTTGVNASASDRAALVNGLNANPATETRASVLQKVVDGIVVISEGNQQFTTTYGQAFYNSESNRAFVQLEYFGYMKRDPDDAGYAFWLDKLNQFSGNFVNAEMVLAFISSPEYRARFGQP